MSDDRLPQEVEAKIDAFRVAAWRDRARDSQARRDALATARASLVSAIAAYARQEREGGREEAREACAKNVEARMYGATAGVAAHFVRKTPFPALSSPPSPARDEKENPHYGKDCPKGMVQVEFVGCPPAARMSDYGWKPTERAFLEVWVDGRRFRIDVGDFHDGREQRRGLHVVTDIGIGFEQTAMNAASLYLPAPSRSEETGAAPQTTTAGYVEDVFGEPVQGGRYFMHPHDERQPCDYDCGGAWVDPPAGAAAPGKEDASHE